MYSKKDLSIIIPTYNRIKDLEATLRCLSHHSRYLREIIVVDQSSNHETASLCRRLKKGIKNLKYLYSKPPSITKARNAGVKKSSKMSRLVCFLDDDVSIGENYFDKILEVFNTFPDARAVSAYFHSIRLSRMPAIEIFLRRSFYISFPENNRARMLAPYANTYPKSLDKTINAEWLPGVNMTYKREIFNEQMFDENLLGYTVAEDIDFTYRLYKRHPSSLFITPYAEIVHRASEVERHPTEKISFINQIDHFYFYYKNMSSSFSEKLKFAWSLIGISMLRIIKTLISRKKEDFLKLRFFFKSLVYCIRNMDGIKKGRVREFITN